MKTKQLSLFSEPDTIKTQKKRAKKPKMGRYERLKRELEGTDNDPYKCFVDINEQPLKKQEYNFVDLFCGAGGISQGLVQAGFKPIASVEINPIASATYGNNFHQCHHFSGDIEEFNPIDWLSQILLD